MSFLSDDGQSDPYARCLGLAEKIINSLQDENIKQNYYQRKQKLLIQSPRRGIEQLDEGLHIDADKAYISYQKFVAENKRLRSELEQIDRMRPNYEDSPENEKIATMLYQLQNKILQPNLGQSPRKIVSSLEEIENLRKIIRAKIGALSDMRNELKQENAQIKSELQQTTDQLNKKLIEAKDKEQAMLLDLSAKDRKIEDKIQNATARLEELKKELAEARAANDALLERHNKSNALLVSMEEESGSAERAVEDLENETDSLADAISGLKVALTTRKHELATLQRLERLGMAGSRGTDIGEELQRLRSQVAALRAENAQTEFEIKRMERKSAIEEPDDDVDEDELAARILRARWN